MTTCELRTEFAAYCGDSLYHRFVRVLNTTCQTKRRLRYWQESVWSEFVQRQAESGEPCFAESFESGEGPFEQANRLLHVCDVHGCELAHGAAPVVYGLVCYPDCFLDAREAEFPFANAIAFRGCGCDGPHGEMDEEAAVEYCPECRRRYEAWRESHEEQLAGAMI
jgi:hypothetical protein